VQSMVRVIQGTAEKAFICLFHQLDNVWHIRWTVVTALASPYERIDSLKIGAGYEAPPRRRRVRQPRHHHSTFAARMDTTFCQLATRSCLNFAFKFNGMP